MIRHKDVKPSNILVKGSVVLYADFGIAYDFKTEATSSTEGYNCHSPMYSAPEVIERQKRSRSSDIFSLGCVLSEMLNVLTRRTVASFYDHRINDGSHAYYATLDKVEDWFRGVQNFGYWNIIESMLSPIRDQRPTSRRIVAALSEKTNTSKCKSCGDAAQNRLEGETIDSTGTGEVATTRRETYLPKLMGPALNNVRLHWVAESGETFPSPEALCWAVETGEKEIVQILLNQGVDIQENEGPKLLFLFKAIELGNCEILRLLLSKGANLSGFVEIGGREYMALQYACVKGHIQIVDILLTAGADCNGSARGWCGRTALQAAAGNGHEKVVEKLITKHTNVNADPTPICGRTALQAASEGGHMGVIGQLLAAGADVNAHPAGLGGRTALQAAAENGHLGVAKLLLAEGADIFASPSRNFGLTALQAAACGGHLHLVRALIREGADICEDPGEYKGFTALQAAAKGGHLEVVQVLLSAGADVDEMEAHHGLTALAAAAGRCHLNVVESLLAAGADVDLYYFDEDDARSNALCAAASGGSDAIVERLLNAGAKVDPDLGAKTPLSEAAYHGNASITKLLLDAGADVNGKNYLGNVAVNLAVNAGEVETTRLLLARNADINTLQPIPLYCEPPNSNRSYEFPDDYKCTPLARAVHAKNEEMVDLLLQYGADINIKSSEGRTPIDDARELGYKSIDRKLREHKKLASKGLTQTR
jgi:ankyrin repeat protein